MTSDSTKAADRAEARLWARILKKCGVSRHPENYYKKGRQIQFLLLERMSDKGWGRLNHLRWEDWYLWHLDHVE